MRLTILFLASFQTPGSLEATIIQTIIEKIGTKRIALSGVAALTALAPFKFVVSECALTGFVSIKFTWVKLLSAADAWSLKDSSVYILAIPIIFFPKLRL
ncbi:MAG: hypothetical protein JO235_10610 [Chroococcidiopsidaceae cyanobacterium CP_BM_RX_35]|nr:hypothetical protein [Chroococcidiopsidaceae cyanobacterium CP_BM_RX_35]